MPQIKVDDVPVSRAEFRELCVDVVKLRQRVTMLECSDHERKCNTKAKAGEWG